METVITLADAPVALVCSLRAAKEVNRTFGDHLSAARRLEAFDLDAYIAIVAAGLGKSRKDVEDKVYAAGMDALVKPLSDYIMALSRGGRPVAAEGEGGSGGNG